MVTDNFIELIHRSKTQDTNINPALAQYETPLVTVDVVVFTIHENKLKVLLIQRNQPPYENMWAIPGGFIYTGETLEEAAARRLHEETNVDNIYLEQLYAFGEPQRDPRARVITVAYFALVGMDKFHIIPMANAQDIGWFSIHNLPDLAFDHSKILSYALERLKARLETSPIAFQLLPLKFTLTELQRVYELILGKELDKRNFRKKILSTDLLQNTQETRMEGYHRPAQLYSFRDIGSSLTPLTPT